jgi:hypothetical protein
MPESVYYNELGQSSRQNSTWDKVDQINERSNGQDQEYLMVT